MDNKIEVRQILEHQIQAFSRLVICAYSNLEGFPSPKQQPAYYEMLENIGKFTTYTDTQIFVATDSNNTLLGGVIYIANMKNYDSNGIAEHIKNASGIRLLAVDAKARGKGVGKLLTNFCIQQALRRNHTQVILHTIKVMRIAWSLYEGMGFKRSKELDFFENGLQIYGFTLKIQIECEGGV